jgi:hypothetical protein
MEDAHYAAFAARLRAFVARAEADETEFNRLALELFGLQFETVPVYRELCLSRRVAPGGIQRWNEIPALPTDSFKDFEVTSLAPEARTTVFYSSGTTAENRSRHFHSRESLAVYEDSLRPWFRRHFAVEAAAMTLLVLTPAREAAEHSSLAYMFDTIAWSFSWATAEMAGGVLPDGTWEVDVERAFNVLRWAERPVAVLGTASAFIQLLDVMPAERLRLAKGSCALETGGYKGRSRALPKAAIHQLISRRLGIDLARIVSEYGMSELSSQAYDRVAGASGGAFHFPPWARAEVISAETGRAAKEGETGLLQVHDLANVRSVQAVLTGDLATKRGEGFDLLGRAEAGAPRGCSLMTV